MATGNRSQEQSLARAADTAVGSGATVTQSYLGGERGRVAFQAVERAVDSVREGDPTARKVTALVALGAVAAVEALSPVKYVLALPAAAVGGLIRVIRDKVYPDTQPGKAYDRTMFGLGIAIGVATLSPATGVSFWGGNKVIGDVRGRKKAGPQPEA